MTSRSWYATSERKSPTPSTLVQLTPSSPVSDAELVRRIGLGDTWAQEALYRRFVEAVLGTVRRLLGRMNDAEDIVQDTFATAFASWDQLREPERVRAWLMQIAVHKVHRRFRQRRLLRTLGLDTSVENASLEALAHSGASPEVRVELAMLDAALAKLPTAARIAWMLRYVEGMALDEVAEACGCSLATAKRRIAEGRAHVAEHVQLPEMSDE